jgi:hypothetical protein
VFKVEGAFAEICLALDEIKEAWTKSQCFCVASS